MAAMEMALDFLETVVEDHRLTLHRLVYGQTSDQIWDRDNQVLQLRRYAAIKQAVTSNEPPKPRFSEESLRESAMAAKDGKLSKPSFGARENLLGGGTGASRVGPPDNEA